MRALTRVATPANESELLDFARCATAAHVERLVRAWRRVDRVAEAADDRRRQESRHLETWVDDDGMVVIRGRLSPEVGAVVRCALEAAADRLYQEAKAADDGVETSAGQRRADALGLVAEAALAADLDRGASTSGDRYQVVVHVDESVLGEDQKDWADGGSRPVGAGGGGGAPRFRGNVSTAGVRHRHRCDAPRARGARARCGPEAADHLARAAPGTDDLGPRVPLSRLSGAPLRRPSCPALGCAGGATRLDNLVRLCRHHHRAVHEEGFRVTLHPDGTARFCRPDGRPLPAAPPAPRWGSPPLAPTLAHLEAAGITIGAETGRPHWYGERLDEV